MSEEFDQDITVLYKVATLTIPGHDPEGRAVISRLPDC